MGACGYLEGHSQAHGMKDQATQPQVSPSQHPQGSPQTGGNPSPPPPPQTVGPQASTLPQGRRGHQGVQEYTQRTPRT